MPVVDVSFVRRQLHIQQRRVCGPCPWEAPLLSNFMVWYVSSSIKFLAVSWYNNKKSAKLGGSKYYWIKRLTKIFLSKSYVPSIPSMVVLKSPNSWLPLSERSFIMIVGNETYPIIPSTISLMKVENSFLKMWAPLFDPLIFHLALDSSSSFCLFWNSDEVRFWSFCSSGHGCVKGSKNLHQDHERFCYQIDYKTNCSI